MGGKSNRETYPRPTVVPEVGAGPVRATANGGYGDPEPRPEVVTEVRPEVVT
ncbi:MAG: hypothetical protein QOE15_534, partial [Acidimicrobiaceae bacterium]|nr:hypothetical protein [Acidimicrobiaceae bacterium]